MGVSTWIILTTQQLHAEVGCTVIDDTRELCISFIFWYLLNIFAPDWLINYCTAGYFDIFKEFLDTLVFNCEFGLFESLKNLFDKILFLDYVFSCKGNKSASNLKLVTMNMFAYCCPIWKSLLQ